jgi:hypothetical protein
MKEKITNAMGLAIPTIIGVVLMGLSLGGCTSVTLRHPETGKTVTCGPFFGDPASDHSARLLKRGCIEDYERQGYERVNGGNKEVTP